MEDGDRGGGAAVVDVECMLMMEEKGFAWGGGVEELNVKEEGGSPCGSVGNHIRTEAVPAAVAHRH